LDSVELDQIYDQIDTVLDGSDLYEAINVLTAILADCVAQATDGELDREAVQAVVTAFVEQYQTICTTDNTAIIH
jgi:hypothetical protein